MTNHWSFVQTHLCFRFWNPKWRASWWLLISLIGSCWSLELSNPGIQLFALAQGALFLLGGVLGQRRPVVLRPVVLWMWMRVLIPFGFQERLQFAYSMRVIVRKPGSYFAKCQSRQSGCAVCHSDHSDTTAPIMPHDVQVQELGLLQIWFVQIGSQMDEHCRVCQVTSCWCSQLICSLDQSGATLSLAFCSQGTALTEALLLVVWGIPGDDAGLLHAGALSIEGKHPSAAMQSDQASSSWQSLYSEPLPLTRIGTSWNFGILLK